MKLKNKRQADDDHQPNRASKRQAVIPTTRITRSSRRLNANNGSAEQLHPGLPMEPRKRKKPVPPAVTQQRRSRADNHVELTVLPATTYVPAPKIPADQAPAEAPSVIYAMGITPDGREIRAPIRIGSDRRVHHHQPQALATSVTTGQEMAEGGPRLGAANPGGPAPIAYMGGDFPVATAHTTGVPPREDARRSNPQQRHSKSSHSSLISPKSGPAQVCSVPTPSRADDPRPSWAPGSTDPDTLSALFEIKLDWSRLNPDWLSRGGDMWKAPEDEAEAAVVEASYSVDSLEEASELIANEMDAQDFGQGIETPVEEILVPDSPQDISPKNITLSQIRGASDPAIVDCDASVLSLDTMEWTRSEEATEELDLDSGAATFRSTMPTMSTQPSLPATRGSLPDSKTESVFPQLTTPEPSKNTFAPSTADVPSHPNLQQRIANLQREKELRDRLIEMRRPRKTAPLPRVQNVLVREADGSMSIIITQDTHVPNWDMEEDQYSVEEYEEDIVSY